jgi:hypothetical protein
MMNISRREFLRVGSTIGVGALPSVRSDLVSNQVDDGRVFHVAPDGDDDNPGTRARPFRTLRPLSASHGDDARDGDTVYLHGGTYEWTERVTFDAVTGLLLTAYGTEKPVIDADAIEGDANTHGVLQFFRSTDCTVRGLEIANAPGPAVDFDESTNPVVEGCVIHHAGGAGIQYAVCRGGAIRDCEVYAGFGPRSAEDGSEVGGDADGIQVTGQPDSPGRDTLIEYNVCHHNSDDGFDFYHSRNLTIRHNLAYANGFDTEGNRAGEAPGKGIKLGASTAEGDGGHRVYNNVAWSNGNSGIGWNGADVPVVCYNNTCIGNGLKTELPRVHGNDFTFYDAAPSCTVYNNIGVEVNDRSYVDSIDESNLEGNSWQLDLPDISELVASLARNDAAVPEVPERFLKVEPSSPAVDAGIELDPEEFPGGRKTLGASTEALPYIGSRSKSYVTTPEPTLTPDTPVNTSSGTETTTTQPGGESGSGPLTGLVTALLVAAGLALLAFRTLRDRVTGPSEEDERTSPEHGED